MSIETQRVCLWSGPRNVSTALMYSFAERSDTEVVDEPLYAHYLRVSGAEHPGWRDVLAAQDQDGERVVQNVVFGRYERPVVLFKQMAHHLRDLDLSFLDRVTNVFLIRDPREMLPSLVHQVPEPKLADTALARQWQVYSDLSEAGAAPPVVDSKVLLCDPEGVLRKLCEALGLPFEETMLDWAAGPRHFDGAWAPHWYHNVHRSTTFAPYAAKTAPFPPELEALYEECRPYYERLRQRAIEA